MDLQSVKAMYKPTGLNLNKKENPMSEARQEEYKIKQNAILAKVTSKIISVTDLAFVTGLGVVTVKNHVKALIEDKKIVRVFSNNPGFFVKAVK